MGTVDWLPPGYGQLVQIALPKDGGQVMWGAVPEIKMSPELPTEQLHWPELKPFKAFGKPPKDRALHEPFVLQISGKTTGNEGDKAFLPLPFSGDAASIPPVHDVRPGGLLHGGACSQSQRVCL